MVTDYLLIRRAARELDRRLRLRRIGDVGLAGDGSIALVLGGRGQAEELRIAPFASPPLVWLVPAAELSLEVEPGWLRAAGASLRGRKIVAVRARRGDRVLRLDLEGRSQFGVADRLSVVIELIPRFGNVLVLKGDTVVAAAKTFSPSENRERSVELGGTYAAPPLGPPRLPRLVAASLALEAERLGLSEEPRADWYAARGAELEAAADGQGPIHVYRRGTEIVAAHVIPLLQFGDLQHSVQQSLVDVFAEVAAEGRQSGEQSRTERRRSSLMRKLHERAAAIRRQLDALEARERELATRDTLRHAGETIYAYLQHIEPRSGPFVVPDGSGTSIQLDPSLSAKANAKRYFERYKKAGASVEHIAKRRAALEGKRVEIESLLWEIERADAEALVEIAADLDGSPPPRTRRKIIPLELASGARLYLGRSPRDNVEVTFRLARPDDVWFHARNVPGSHVVLHPAPGDDPSDDEIRLAAQLAAEHSRARNSGAVEVDYTLRKFVRQQRDAAPGMVWYTNAKTIRVAPAQAVAPRRAR